MNDYGGLSKSDFNRQMRAIEKKNREIEANTCALGGLAIVLDRGFSLASLSRELSKSQNARGELNELRNACVALIQRIDVSLAEVEGNPRDPSRAAQILGPVPFGRR